MLLLSPRISARSLALRASDTPNALPSALIQRIALAPLCVQKLPHVVISPVDDRVEYALAFELARLDHHTALVIVGVEDKLFCYTAMLHLNTPAFPLSICGFRPSHAS